MRPFASIVLACFGVAALAAPARAQFVDGDLYVSDLSSTIYRVDPATWTVTTFADSSDGLNGVSASALSPAGTLLCSNYTSSTVLEFDSAGNAAALYDSSDGLNGPYGENGLAYSVNGDLYVSNFLNHEILRFPAGGEAPPSSPTPPTGSPSPSGSRSPRTATSTSPIAARPTCW